MWTLRVIKKNALKNFLTHFQWRKLQENNIPRKIQKFSYETWTFENSVVYYNLGHKPANFEEFSVALCLQKIKIPLKLHLHENPQQLYKNRKTYGY